jgi:DNA end-binding protein Ku
VGPFDDRRLARVAAGAGYPVGVAPRSIWNGTVTFGLVAVPIKLYTATESKSVSFREVHAREGARIEHRRICSKEGREVPYEEVAHSYDLDGKQVIVTDEELASVQPRKTRTIDVEAFVDLADVDPIFFDHPYFLVPAGESEGTLRAYRLLVEAMGATDRAALGRFVMRTKDYPALGAGARRRAGPDHDALRRRGAADFARPQRRTQEADQEAARLRRRRDRGAVHRLGSDRYEDCYRERLRRVIEDKRRRRKIKAPEPVEQPSPAADLMEALERTLEEARAD